LRRGVVQRCQKKRKRVITRVLMMLVEVHIMEREEDI